MKRLAIGGIAAACVMLLLAGCGGNGSSGADDALQRQADLYALGELEKTFHKALSTKDIELMMSIWAPNATLTQGSGQTRVGKDEIRRAWLETKAFDPTNQWVSETPAYKIRATVHGDKGTLFFECHFVDVRNERVVSIVGADWQVARINGRWQVKSMVGGSAALSP